MALTVHSKTQNGRCEVEEIDVFSQFDVVSDASDHFFHSYRSAKSYPFGNPSNGVHKKIMKEWRILEKSLPESIVVRVYEKRIDLLRAAIVGSAGTPYHDGLFFFDLAFPSDYPARPPHVRYQFFGLRINPYFYADGHLCWFLIKWNPKQSTVLQVLVSLQALVLNEKPYFSHPASEIWPWKKTIREKRSDAYNEDVFVMSCKTMLYLMRYPPKNFERFVVGHFRDRGSLILSACRSYANGSFRVGSFKNNDGPETSSSEVSKKFKKSLKQLYPLLSAAFLKAGASLENSMKELDVEVEDEEESGVARMLFGKLKRDFRLIKLGGIGSGNEEKDSLINSSWL